jgi:NHL repeat-containing protein
MRRRAAHVARLRAVLVATTAVLLLCAVSAEAASYGPAAPVGSGYSGPTGVAVGSAGEVFVADTGHNRIEEVSSGGIQTTLTSDVTGPTGIAVGPGDTVYVTEDSLLTNALVKVSSSGQVTSLATGLVSPKGVAVDSAGDAFVAEPLLGEVVEIPPNGGQSTVAASGLLSPYGVAFDRAGDMFVSENLPVDGQVVEIASGGTQTTVASLLQDPANLAVDPAGDVLVANTVLSQVAEITPAGATSTVGSGYLLPQGIALDSSGDLFVADTGNNRVVELPFDPDGSATSVGCGPAAAAGVAQTCTATVSDAVVSTLTPPGTVQFSSDGAGSFSPNSCLLLDGSCSVPYTPAVAGNGSQTITAVYSGAFGFITSTMTGTLQITAIPSKTILSCAHPTAGQLTRLAKGIALTIGCTAKVLPHPVKRGTVPVTGPVSFTVPPGVTLSSSTCALPGRAGWHDGCTVKLTIDEAGTYSVSAAYGSDATYLESSAERAVTIK